MIKEKFWIVDDVYNQSMDCEPQCMTCKNERSNGKCTVYPKGIPMDILTAKRKDCKFYKSLEQEK
jgi:hypothetical protein